MNVVDQVANALKNGVDRQDILDELVYDGGIDWALDVLNRAEKKFKKGKIKN